MDPAKPRNLGSFPNTEAGLEAYRSTWCGRVAVFLQKNRDFLTCLRIIPVISTLVVPIFMKIMANYQNYANNISNNLHEYRDNENKKLDQAQIAHIQGKASELKKSYDTQQRINFVSLIPVIGNIAAACLDYKRRSDLTNR